MALSHVGRREIIRRDREVCRGRQIVLRVAASGISAVWSVGIMQRLTARIAKQLAEFRNNNTEPDYEEQARIILLIVNEERQAEIREWRAKQNEQG